VEPVPKPGGSPDHAYAVPGSGLLDIIEHSNPTKYPGQRVFVVDIEGYACLVPFVEDEESVFLKTVIPSRKMTERYLGGRKR
jgi:hypothetical protein